MKHIKAYTLDQSKRNTLFILTAFVTIGIFIGAFFGARGVDIPDSPWVHQYLYPPFKSGHFLDAFRNTVISSVFFLASIFLFGLFAAGQPLGAAMLVYRGFGIGSCASMLYSEYGRGAVPVIIILLIPKSIAFVYISILAVREDIRCSNFILRSLLYTESDNFKRVSFRLYCIKFLVLILISVAVSALDIALNYFLMRSI